MPQINQLPTRTPTAGDLVAFFSTNNGDAAKTSFTAIATLMTQLMGVSGGGGFITQYSQPTATAFTVTVGGVGQSAWLVLTPTTAGFTGTITLPDVATVVDQQEFSVVTTNAVSLTYSASGMTVYGAPTDLAAGGSFTLRYDLVSKFWYCVAIDSKVEVKAAIVSASGVLTIDCSAAAYFTTTLFENVTSVVLTNLPLGATGKTIMVKITQDSDTAKTVAFPSSFKWAGASTGVVSTTLSAVDVLAITSFDNGTTWNATLANGFA